MTYGLTFPGLWRTVRSSLGAEVLDIRVPFPRPEERMSDCERRRRFRDAWNVRRLQAFYAGELARYEEETAAEFTRKALSERAPRPAYSDGVVRMTQGSGKHVSLHDLAISIGGVFLQVGAGWRAAVKGSTVTLTLESGDQVVVLPAAPPGSTFVKGHLTGYWYPVPVGVWRVDGDASSKRISSEYRGSDFHLRADTRRRRSPLPRPELIRGRKPSTTIPRPPLNR